MTPLAKYIWLIEQLQNKDMTFEEINEQWLRDRKGTEDENMPILKRTFFNHIKAIREEYGIHIECGRGYKYYISDQEEVILPKMRLLSELNLLNEVAIDNKPHKSIYVEDDLGIFHDDIFWTIANAIKINRKVKLEIYRDFNSAYLEITVAPYQLHYIYNRWYLIGMTDDSGLMRIPLLGVIHARQTDISYEYPANYSAEKYSKMIYGTTNERICLDIKMSCPFPEDYFKYIPIAPFQKKIEYKSWVDDGNPKAFPLNYYTDNNYTVMIGFELPKTPFAVYILKSKLFCYLYNIMSDMDPFMLFTEEQCNEAADKPTVL
jgi:hypothetical protein